MACEVIDPRMMDLVWTDRLDYEALLHKRPSCTQAQPTSAPSTTEAASAPKKSDVKEPDVKKAEVKKSSTESSVKADGKSLLADLEAARGFIRASLEQKTPESTLNTLQERATRLETSNSSLRKLVDDLTKQIDILEAKAKSTGSAPAAAPAKPAAAPAKKEDSDDDDFDFGDSDEEETPKGETEMQKMKRLAAEKKVADEAAKKAKKPAAVLKSNVVLDIKPWSDETDLQEMEKAVRAIVMEGLTWGNSKFVEIGFGIKKLRMSTCIIDELVGLYDLEDNIQELEDYVQSVDIVSHNKI